jgi:hypothetical protein
MLLDRLKRQKHSYHVPKGKSADDCLSKERFSRLIIAHWKFAFLG